jgi:hypothetical protein
MALQAFIERQVSMKPITAATLTAMREIPIMKPLSVLWLAHLVVAFWHSYDPTFVGPVQVTWRGQTAQARIASDADETDVPAPVVEVDLTPVLSGRERLRSTIRRKLSAHMPVIMRSASHG